VNHKILASTALALGVLSAYAATSTTSPVPYPEGYRQWQHIKSMVIQPGHALHDAFGGIHHLYGNAKAMAGYRSGKFADGSVIVFDLLEANTAGNAISEGKRKVLGVMHKNARQYAATGGWGFEGFAGDSKTQRAVGNNAATACYACHTAQQKQDFVFSSYRQ
jgi:hypothetical protein